jgi:predicted DNA binding CopG/RHH family protein
LYACCAATSNISLTVSIRLPESLIAELKMLANKRDVPYQSLVKMFLAEKVKEESTNYDYRNPG